jgi:hypothetical protein
MNLIKFTNIFFIFVIIVLAPFGFVSYSGSKVYYVIFSLISSYALLISFNKYSISFDTFFSLLIWLGLWFKFTVQISFFNSMFPEGAGIFDYKSNSYDQILIISSVSILGFIFARFVRIKFIFDYINLSSTTYNNDHYVNFYSKYRKNIFYIYFFSIIFFALINYIFVFFQKGTIPEVILPFGLNNFINWLLMFGLTTFSSLIVFFEFHYKKKNSNKIVKYGLLETFISSISILSRAMIFNGTALIYGFYRLIEINKIEIKIKNFIKYFSIVLILFMICLLIVSKIRQSKDFPVGHEVHKYIPQIVTEGSVFKLAKLANDFSKEINQIIFLISGRWVGIEGIMAVYSNKDINYDSFLNSFNDRFDYSNSFYENTVKKSKHIYKENPKIFTVYTPGIIAFLFYTKSLIFLFCGIFLICIFCSIIEYFSYKLSRGNIVFSYIIGNVLAYRLAHFGYMPQNTYKLLFAIIFNLLLVFVILKFIQMFWGE